MKLKLGLMALVLSFTAGCSTIPGSETIAATAAGVADVFAGPDTDYTNYLRACSKEVAAQKEATTSDNTALQSALTSKDEKVQLGGMLIMAFKAGQNPKQIGCSVERKKGFAELLMRDGNILDFGFRVYQENRAGARFERQLQADKEITKMQLDAAERAREQQNDLLTTLSGDKRELQQDANAAKLDELRITNPTPPAAE